MPEVFCSRSSMARIWSLPPSARRRHSSTCGSWPVRITPPALSIAGGSPPLAGARRAGGAGGRGGGVGDERGGGAGGGRGGGGVGGRGEVEELGQRSEGISARGDQGDQRG